MDKTEAKEFLTMRDKFYNEPKIKALLEKKRRYISVYDYVNAIKTNDMIEMLFDKYSAESEKKSNSILDAMLGLEDERDSKRIVTEFFSSIMMINAVDFMIAECVLPPVTVQLGLDKRCFIQVLTLFFLFVNPQFRKHFRDLVWHQAREYGVSCILRGGWQDAAV